ncbi:hypothetical protein Syun_028135 [Stephania yunnanensis]|uniref:NAC domain-containing protein n=1 Tax=Stephania yunnanensis TaxID=152371 RepID=A0AAP0HNG4_9MAGN
MLNLLSMVEAKLPPGFRFHPRDEELVCDYLMKKVMGMTENSQAFPLLMEVDLNSCEPWDLPEAACVGGREWYFYNQLDRKYATGARTNRATTSGYWKATGKDRRIVKEGLLVGMKKTLVFYQGRAPKGKKSNWVMHEHRIHGPSRPSKLHTFQGDWVLCKVYYKGNRDSTKSSDTKEDNYDEVDVPTRSSPSPSLPPLTPTDSCIIFDQTPPNTKEFVQVPCFSISTSHQTNPDISHFAHLIPPKNLSHLDAFPQCDADPTLACDSQVLRVVLDHLTMFETQTKGELYSPSGLNR